MKKALILFLTITILLNQYSWAGNPTLRTILTVVLPGGEQVPLYGDSEGDKKLYIFPARITLKEIAGRPAFNAVVYRGILNVSSEDLQNIETSSLNGGLVDVLMELSGPTKDIKLLKTYVAQQYPRYRNYDIALVPLIPGSASVAFSHLPVSEAQVPQLAVLNNRERNKLSSFTSGGPVSSQAGGGISARFRLSEIDALIMLETLSKSKNNNSFTGAFDAKFSAKARVNFPETIVKITANERQVYKYVESHFRSSGGFFFFSYNIDIRKIREKLEQDGHLKVSIDNQNPDIFPHEFLQKFADKWLENYVLKTMHKTELKIPGVNIAPDEKSKRKPFFDWINIGIGYQRINIEQTIDKEVSFTWQYKGVQTFPVYAEAEFSGIGPQNVITIDYNKSYFTYQQFAVLPMVNSVMQDPLFGNATFVFRINDQERRTVNLNRNQYFSQVEKFPLFLDYGYDPITDAIKGQVASKVSYDFIYNGKTANFTVKNIPFEHSNWEFDLPSVRLQDHLGHVSIELLNCESLFSTFPSLVDIEVRIPIQGSEDIRYVLHKDSPERSYFFDKRDSNLSYIEIVATYRKGTQYVKKTSNRRVGKILNKIEIREQDIPEILIHGR